jgi:hypothetical protein
MRSTRLVVDELAQRLPNYEQYVARQGRRDERASERAALEYWDNLSTGEKLIQGGLVGLIDEDVSAGARNAIYGTEDPSPGQVALVTLPTTIGLAARGSVGSARLADAALGRFAPRVAEFNPFHWTYTRGQIAKEAVLGRLGAAAVKAAVTGTHTVLGNRRDEGLLTQSRLAGDRLLARDPFWRDLFRWQDSNL